MSFKKLLSSFLIGTGFLAIIVAGIFWNNLDEVKGAPSPVPDGSVIVTGYAWSSNIGWISFSPSYGGVFYNPTNGQLSGYAWSSNIGWISFENNLTVDPLGVGGASAKASPLAVTGYFSGWARACTGTQSNTCSSMTSRTDGWDGWIKFDTGMSNPVSINLTSSSANYGDFSGYAWGSEVVGWISFNCLNTSSCTTGSNYKVKANIVPPSSSSSLVCTVNCGGGGYDLTINITGSGTGGVSDSDDVLLCYGSNGESCVIKNYNEGAIVTLSASADSGDSFDGWGLSCSGTGNCEITMSSDKTVSVSFGKTDYPYPCPPYCDGDSSSSSSDGGGSSSSEASSASSASSEGGEVVAYISASPNPVPAAGQFTMIDWGSSGATSCEPSGGDEVWTDESLRSDYYDDTGGTYTTTPFESSELDRIYTITCTNGSQTGSASVTVGVGNDDGDPFVQIWADPQSISYNRTSQIKWLSSNILNQSCFLYSESNSMNGYLKYYNITNYLGPGYYNGYIENSNTTGQTTGELTVDTTYKILCQREDYSFLPPAQTTVIVAPPVSNFDFTNPSGNSLIATIVENLSANSSSVVLALSGEAISYISLSATLPSILSGAEARFSVDGGLNWTDTLSVNLNNSGYEEFKVKVIDIPGATLVGTYNVAFTATDTGNGGKTKKLNVKLEVKKITSEWQEF